MHPIACGKTRGTRRDAPRSGFCIAAAAKRAKDAYRVDMLGLGTCPRRRTSIEEFSRRPTARGAVRGPRLAQGAPRKPFAWGAFSRTYTNTQPINFICILSGFDGRRGAKTTPRCISPGRSRPHASNGVEVVPLHVYLRKRCLDRTFTGVSCETVFGAILSTSKKRTNGHRKLQ